MLLVELEGRGHLAPLFGIERLTYEPTVVESGSAGVLSACQLTPDVALQEYLDGSGLGRITDRLTRTGAIDTITAAAPGIRDLLVLGKIRQLEQGGEHDLIIIDAPAAGHAVTFLQSPSGMADSAPSGPIRDQADLILEMFADERRCQVMLVTLPEEAAVTELIETAYSLEDAINLRLSPVVVNSRWPEVPGLEAALQAAMRPRSTEARAAAQFRLRLLAAQQAQVDRLGVDLPLPQLDLPYLFTTRLERSDLDTLASEFTAQLDRGLRQ